MTGQLINYFKTVNLFDNVTLFFIYQIYFAFLYGLFNCLLNLRLCFVKFAVFLKSECVIKIIFVVQHSQDYLFSRMQELQLQVNKEQEVRKDT